MNLIPVFLIIVIVAISGCIFPSASTGSGVVIEEFRPDFSQLMSDESFTLELKVKNAGSMYARRVFFDLLNTVGSDGRTQIYCTRGCGDNLDIYPMNPESGTSGETKTCFWECDAPEGVPYGVKINYNPIIRVKYNYESSALALINFVSREELKNMQSSGAPMPFESSRSTNAPIALTIIFKGPIRYWDNIGRVGFPIEIKIDNVGGGVPCYPDCENKDDWNKVRLKTSFGGNINLEECDFQGSKDVLLWEKSRSVRCQATFNDVLGIEAAGLTTRTFGIDAEYEYFVEKTTTIEVTGV